MSVVPNDEKFRELILHISRVSEGDEAYGATKLNKLLFYADFLAYLLFGKPITGQEYQRLPKGPAPRQLLPIQRELLDSGAIATRENGFFGYTQKRTLALREADLSHFSATEIALVDKLVGHWWGKTASAMSEASHHFVGWKCAADGETIPYEVALVGNRPPTKDEVEHAQSLESLASECITV